MNRLKELIKEREITVYRLAKDLDCPRSTVRSWLNGTIPRDDKLQILANYFHVHPAWLRYGDNQYAPTLQDRVMRIAEKMQSYPSKKIDTIEKIVNALDDSKRKEKTG